MAPAMVPTPQPAGDPGPPPPAGGASRRLGLVVLGLLAIGACGVALAAAVQPPAAMSLVMVAAALFGFTGGLSAALLRAPARPVWVPGQLTARDRAIDDSDLAGELRWRWRKACEGAGVSRMTWTPSGWSEAVPVVVRTTLRPVPSLTVRLRPDQDIRDVLAARHRLAQLMRVNQLVITPLSIDIVRIELW